jgi:hypothetical protein
MRRLFVTLLLLGSLAGALAADTATGRVVKVLPLLLDSRGRESISPSLYDRDAYQVYLRQPTNEVSGIRFDILWKAAHAGDAKLKLRVELRGGGTNGLPCQTALEQTVTPGYFRRWTSLTLSGTNYASFGKLTAWRASLWSDDRLLGEQKSFLW